MPSITAAAPVGGCVYLGGAYAFVKGSDNNLWCAWPAGGLDTCWTKLASNIAIPVGVLSSNRLIFAFVQGNDGALYCNWTDGGSWRSLALGTPKAGVGIAGAVGVWSSGEFVYVFVRGSDGHLWTCWWNRTAWSWLDLGAPPGLTVGAGVGITMTPGPYAGSNPVIYVMVQGSDSKLWTCWWNGALWSWANLAGAFAAPIGVIYNGAFVYVFLKGTDGKLLCIWLSGNGWIPVNLGLPDGGVQIIEGVGAASYLGNPVAYFRGSDGRLWARVWSANQWNWADMGHPHFASVAGGIGVSVYQRTSGGLSDTDKAVAGLGVSMGAIQIGAGAAQFKSNPAGAVATIAGGTQTVAENSNTLANSGSSLNTSVYVFVRGTDGHVWVNTADGQDTSWMDFGTVDWT